MYLTVNYPSPKGKGLVKAQIDQPKCFGHYVSKNVCPICNSTYDRDYNAALNIRDEGYRLYMERLKTVQSKSYIGWGPSESTPVESITSDKYELHLLSYNVEAGSSVF